MTDSESGAGASGGSSGSGSDSGGPTDPLAALSEEFDDPDALTRFENLSTLLGTEPYDLLDAHVFDPGHLTIIPQTSGWYDDYVGVFVFKPVAGDFMVETSVVASSRVDAGAAPSQLFNSAGLLVRNPASGPGDQNWVAHNVGRQVGTSPIGSEGKTTVSSDSLLELIPGPNEARLRICRVGQNIVLARLTPDESAWVQTHSFTRPDFPVGMQVGVMTNAWNTGGQAPNHAVEPDLVASFDYVRFSSIASAADCLTPSP